MPRVLVQLPPLLKPYVSLGVQLAYRPGVDEAPADCPWCGGEAKFSVNAGSGMWQCWACGEKGNLVGFLRCLHDYSMQQTRITDYAALAADRRLLSPDTLVRWGVCKSLITGGWLVPGYGGGGKLDALYRYEVPYGGTKRVLQLPPEVGHGLFGVGHYDAAKPDLWLCEGCWDGMCLEEVLRGCKRLPGTDGPDIVPTASVASSLAGTGSVLAVPGCGIFNDYWLPLFAGRRVVLCYDSDHPKLHCRPCHRSWSRITHTTCPTCAGELTPPEVPPAGYTGLRRTARLLSQAKEPPESVRYIEWGPEGWDAGLPSGWDLRDALAG